MKAARVKTRKPWPSDAPEGYAWKCPNCRSWATIGGNAGFHRDQEKHGEPTLVPIDPDGCTGFEAAPIVDEPDEQVKVSDFVVPDREQIRLWIVWTIGSYTNGVRLLDIRAITTSKPKAILYSKMLRRDKEPGERWERVVIEPRCANHLYAEKWREFMVNTGKM